MPFFLEKNMNKIIEKIEKQLNKLNKEVEYNFISGSDYIQGQISAIQVILKKVKKEVNYED